MCCLYYALERLEDRNLPAPVATGTAAIAAALPVTLPGISAPLAAGINANAASGANVASALAQSSFVTSLFQALMAGSRTGTPSPAGSSQLAGLLTSFTGGFFSTPAAIPSVFSASNGAPSGVRGSIAPLFTPGSGSSLPPTNPYVNQDMNLSGGGGTSTNDRSRNLDDTSIDDQQEQTSALECTQASDRLAAAVMQEAFLRVNL